MKDTIEMTKDCKSCNISFDITNLDLEFYKKISPTFNGEKFDIPVPKLCPDCRQQRRLSFRNERNLYKRKCDATGKSIISMYSPDKKLKVYNSDFWWSDKWDGLDYGVDFDFSRNFFEQFEELKSEVPTTSMYSYFGENSDYCNCVNYQKNCYLTFASSKNEDCLYCDYTNDSFSCIDCFMTFDSENCYQATDCKKCYKVFNSHNCLDCSVCLYCSDLINCSNCFGCNNLVGKSYCFENNQLTKEEYLKKISNIPIYKPKNALIKKFITGSMNEKSTGDYMRNCKNVNNSFDVNNLEECKFNAWFHDSKNCYDTYSWGQQSEMCLEGVAIGDNCSFLLFCANVDSGSSNVYYSMHCSGVKDVFGCVGLKNKSYCIFNKQYTKNEYNKLVPKIINHMKNNLEWGDFFPNKISLFGYNETVAQEYFPLDKDDIFNKGYNWSDCEQSKPNVDKIIPADKLPKNIEEIPDDLLNWAIECEVTNKPFRILKPELGFYRKYNIQIPKRHPDIRFKDRLKVRNPRKLYDRECDKCGIDIKTTYSNDMEELVYCESCYEKEIY